MSDLQIGFLAIAALFMLVLAGVPIAFALIAVSVVGMFLITGSIDLTGLLASNAALGGVRNYVFVVVPLFVLMGAFMSNSSAARYLYAVAHIVTRRLIGGLATATVFANAVFSAVTGVSVASAAIFARISIPEMVRHGYNLRLALGAVAGSSVLGMLIPPSLLMILYGVLAQVSIGSLFIAGIVPGLLLALLYTLTIAGLGYAKPEWVGSAKRRSPDEVEEARELIASMGAEEQEVRGEALGTEASPPGVADGPDFESLNQDRADVDWDQSAPKLLVGTIPIGLLIVGVIGGIWLGWFTPTEAAAVGAAGALIVAGIYGMRGHGLVNSFRETAISTGAIMLLLISAQMYSRMLARSGMINSLTQNINDANLTPTVLILLFVFVLVVLGAILDSSSILLIMVPLMVPAVVVLEQDPLWFGIVMIIAIEIGLLTPPFGMVAFSMSAVLGSRVTVEDIFVGAIPFIGAMFVTLFLVMLFPGLVTWLPGLL